MFLGNYNDKDGQTDVDYIKITEFAQGGGSTIISGDSITSGQITSNNHGSSAGTNLNLDDGLAIFGGSANQRIEINGANASMSFFDSSGNNVITLDDNLVGSFAGMDMTNGIVRIVESSDFGNSNDSAPLYIEANSQAIGSNRTAGYFAIGNSSNANTLWDAGYVSGKGCDGSVASRRYMAGIVCEANLNVCPATPQVTSAIVSFANASDSYSFYGISGLLHNVGEIQSQADVVAYASSDRRQKDNIVEIDNPLGKIKQIRGVYFDWNEKGPDWTKGWPGNPKGKKHDVGVIAQEVQKVLPEVVSERTKDSGMEGMLAVDYEKIVPLLIEGIKEQQTMIEDLQNRIKKLEEK